MAGREESGSQDRRIPPFRFPGAGGFLVGGTMEKWVMSAKRADFQEIGKKFHIDPVTARLIRNRDVEGEAAIEEYLHGGLEKLHDPVLMRDMERAAELLNARIRMGKSIRIIGDYDIDGVMSTYILLQGLRDLGARVDARIPERIRDGYGLNIHLIQEAAEDGIDTLVTCDNGISAGEQIALAKEQGMLVVVTDHHEVPFLEEGEERREVLPPADAVIDPKRTECGYPFKGLCGAAVAWKLVTMLERLAGEPREKSFRFLEFVAAATIGDVMDLVGENRILVREGLKRLQHTENLGLRALIQVNGLEGTITPYHVGFVIGPCLNAGGRLDTARRALQLLMAETQEEAAVLAGDLKALNESRKEMTAQGLEAAVELVETTSLKDDKVLVVYLPDCHESLAGIIAGRLREKYGKPSFVLTRTEEGVKGSGRSIEAYSMYEELNKCRELFTKFGGHLMAAGLSLPEEQVPRMRCRLNENCRLTEEDLAEKVIIDVPMPISYIRRELVDEFSLLEPFGKGNSKPVFAQRNLTVLGCRIFGKNRNVVKMTVRDEQGFSMGAVYFGNASDFCTRVQENPQLDLVYYPSVNNYQGRESLQLVITHFR